MELDALIRALAPGEVIGHRPVEIGSLAHDTRRVEPGALFFCIVGERLDGHDLAGEAVTAGAVALVVQHSVDVAVPQLVVEDVRAAMAVAADVFNGEPTLELDVVGVTGTNGKTTTSYLVRGMLEAAGRTPGLVGTVDWIVAGVPRPAAHTTPEAIELQALFREMADAGDRSVVIEASSHGSHFRRLDRVRFDALVFTNLSQDHLDLHGDLEEYFQAKRRLFTGVQPPPAAVNIGDPHGRRLAEELEGAHRAPLVTFGLRPEAEVRAEGLELTSSGSRFTAAGIPLETSLRGIFNVENVLGAVAAGVLLGLEDHEIEEGIRAVTGVPGRFEAVDLGQPFAVIVDYAHTPDALATVLTAARDLGEGRLTVVFGAGGDRDRDKRRLMGDVARRHADHVIVTSDNPRSEDPMAIIEDLLQGAGVDVEVDPERRSAIDRAIAGAADGDIVVVAGKGHEQGQEIAGVVHPFDDLDRRPRGARTPMIPVALDEIRALGLGPLVGDAPAGVVTRIHADSRDAAPGDLFVALNTGVRYVDDARARGAVTLVPDDQYVALATLARVVRGRSDARVVAVVGSTGKTSTKDALGALCAAVTPTVSAHASQNNEIGLPLTVLRLEPDTRVLVTELGMRGLGEIAALCEIARPDVTLVTSIGPEHLELVGSVENVARANAEAIEALPTGGIVVVPTEARELDPYLRDDLDVRRFDRTTPVRDGEGWSFEVGGQTVELALTTPQRHMAGNVLAALTAYDALGLPLDRAREGAARITLSPWRGETVALPGGGFVVNDAYNANPTSMRAALLDLAERAEGRRRVAILGEMAELGEAAAGYHEQIGALVAELGIECVVAIGALAQAYLPTGGAETQWVATRDELRLPGPVRPGDAVLVKASRAGGLEGIPAELANIAEAWSAS